MLSKVKSNEKSVVNVGISEEISKVCFNVLLGVSIVTGLFAVSCLIGGIVATGGIVSLVKSLFIATFV